MDSKERILAAINHVQPLATDMDPFSLKSKFGDRLCFHGGIDIQELLPNASEQEVHRQVRKHNRYRG